MSKSIQRVKDDWVLKLDEEVNPIINILNIDSFSP
jgi:hypothetical protein